LLAVKTKRLDIEYRAAQRQADRWLASSGRNAIIAGGHSSLVIPSVADGDTWIAGGRNQIRMQRTSRCSRANQAPFSRPTLICFMHFQ
jgi:hypothetical protein